MGHAHNFRFSSSVFSRGVKGLFIPDISKELPALICKGQEVRSCRNAKPSSKRRQSITVLLGATKQKTNPEGEHWVNLKSHRNLIDFCCHCLFSVRTSQEKEYPVTCWVWKGLTVKAEGRQFVYFVLFFLIFECMSLIISKSMDKTGKVLVILTTNAVVIVDFSEVHTRTDKHFSRHVTTSQWPNLTRLGFWDSYHRLCIYLTST
jgi:hypothetical protein